MRVLYPEMSPKMGDQRYCSPCCAAEREAVGFSRVHTDGNESQIFRCALCREFYTEILLLLPEREMEQLSS